MFEYLATLIPCLNPTKTTDPESSSTLPFNSPCTFCGISKEKGFKIVWEDEILVAFKDHKPAAKHHILVVPKAHIRTVKSLRRTDADLVRSMEKAGHTILDDLSVSPSARRLGFHIPPFNSVNHLHLHVHGLPYKSVAQATKYTIASGTCPYQKGFSWFSEVGQTIRILENGGVVGLYSC